MISELQVIEVWAAVAWADGALADTEARGMRAVIAAAKLGDADRGAALRFLDRKVELPDAYLAGLSAEARRGIYRAACRMAIVDGVLAATERSLLDRLRGKLDIPADIAVAVEAEVPGLTV
jgi:uncharacterized membrane protein YebE (DUF533 family)